MIGKKVFLTGANGMLGSNIARILLKEGYEINALIESGGSTETLNGLQLRIFEGDLSNINDIEPAVKMSDIVIHTAASTQIWPGRNRSTWDINYQATKNLIALCKTYGIRKFIHVGTANSFGHGSKDDPGDELRQYSSAKFKLDYLDSKRAVQEYILNDSRQNQFPAVIINPTFMLGPFGNRNGSNKLLLALYNKELPGSSPGGKNYVDVRDVASAIVNSVEKGVNGECYIAGNTNMSYREFFSTVGEALNIKASAISMPGFITLMYGGLSSFLSMISGKQPKVSYAIARLGCTGFYYSPAKAVRELNMPQTPIKKTISDTIDYYKQTGDIS